MGFFYIISNKVLEGKADANTQVAEDISQEVMNEIFMAKSVEDGYRREFMLPKKIDGAGYEAYIIENRELVVRFEGNEHVDFIPNGTFGNVSPGLNVINKSNGVVWLQRG